MSARRTKRIDGRSNVTLTVEPPDGAKRRVYFYGPTQVDARRKADAARGRVARPGELDQAPLRRADRASRRTSAMANGERPVEASTRASGDEV